MYNYTLYVLCREQGFEVVNFGLYFVQIHLLWMMPPYPLFRAIDLPAIGSHANNTV